MATMKPVGGMRGIIRSQLVWPSNSPKEAGSEQKGHEMATLAAIQTWHVEKTTTFIVTQLLIQMI